MIPIDVEEFYSEGERAFYKFLQAVGKADSRYISWYLPDVKDKEPDFLLFCEEIGLTIFEVKDCNLGQIREANPYSYTLDIGGKTELSRGNPLQQAHDYLNSIKNKIREDGRLVSRSPHSMETRRSRSIAGSCFPISTNSSIQRKALTRSAAIHLHGSSQMSIGLKTKNSRGGMSNG